MDSTAQLESGEIFRSSSYSKALGKAHGKPAAFFAVAAIPKPATTASEKAVPEAVLLERQVGDGDEGDAAREPAPANNATIWINDFWWSRVADKSGVVIHPLDRWVIGFVSMIEKITFCWVSPLIHLAQHTTLDEPAMPTIPAKDEAMLLTAQLETAWNHHVATTPKDKISLAWCYYGVFKGRFWKTGTFLAIEGVLQIGQAVVVGKLVGALSDGESDETCYQWAVGMALVSFGYGAVMHHQAFMSGWRFAAVAQAATLGIVFRKSLRVSQQGLAKVSVGHVTNLITNDAERFLLGCIFVYFIAIAPVMLLVSLWLLWQQVGWPAIFGPVLLALLAPLYYYLGRLLKRLRLRTAKITDDRVKKMNEFLQGMRVIKMNAWETPLHALIKKIRDEELSAIRKTNFIRAFNLSLYFMSPIISSFVVLLPYSHNGNTLTNEKIFLCIALFNAIRFPVSMGLPNSVQAIAEMSVVFQRLQEFMLLDEVDKVAPGAKQNENGADGDHLSLDDVSCTWDDPTDEQLKANPAVKPCLQLQNISVKVKRGELLMVVGPVGCGKSTLLNVLLSELQPTSGTVTIGDGAVGYCPQDSWILNATVRDNIIFGATYNEAHFQKVVRVCQLQRDFDGLPDADLTVLGERGVNLSGGQRARISLARSIYHQPELVLLDDPLSAVDAKVGHEIFDGCICRFLKGTTRILVTHQVQHAAAADRILVLSQNGTVVALGTHDELTAAGVNLKGLVFVAGEVDDGPAAEVKGAAMYDSSTDDSSATATVGVTAAAPAAVTAGGDTKAPGVRDSVVAETSVSGTISGMTYINYFRNAGGLLSATFVLFLFVAAQGLEMYSAYFLQQWTSQSAEGQQDEKWTYQYIAVVVSLVVVTLGRSMLFMHGGMNASTGLHAKVVSSILRVPIRFIDTNPTGRILNRFSKDTGFIDDLLPVTFLDFLGGTLMCASATIVVSIINPFVFILTVPLTVVFFKLRNYYLRASREIKRLEAVLRSPKYSLLNSTLGGLSTIRSRENADTQFTAKMHELQNQHLSAYMMFMVGSRWLGFRLDIMGFALITTVTFAGIAMRDEIGAGEIGLSLVYIMALSGLFQWTVRQSAEVENQMTAVERMLEYADLDTEQSEMEMLAPGASDTDWPKTGTIAFESFGMSYSPDGDQALRSLTLSVNDREKVGIVGRTGAGKSSLLAALFRMSYTRTGRIMIDGRDIADVPLKVLRSAISVIPQEPVLFSGTIRDNVDPFENYDDEAIWTVLGDVQLKNVLSDGLLSKVTENGQNFSVGQRQLICMARAMLQKNRILVLDEATANIDSETDQLIQTIIRSKFKDWTVLTIAHRLKTVIDSDRIAVLDAGRVMDYATPAELLKHKGGLLAELAAYSKSKKSEE